MATFFFTSCGTHGHAMLDGFTIHQKPRSSLTQRFSSPLRQEGCSPYDRTGLLLVSLSFLDPWANHQPYYYPASMHQLPRPAHGTPADALAPLLACCLALALTLTLGKIPHTHTL